MAPAGDAHRVEGGAHAWRVEGGAHGTHACQPGRGALIIVGRAPSRYTTQTFALSPDPGLKKYAAGLPSANVKINFNIISGLAVLRLKCGLTTRSVETAAAQDGGVESGAA